MNLKKNMASALFAFTLLAGCGTDRTGVSVHGVNYTEDELTYGFFDPKNEKNVAGGESILPFSAGGIMCCYSVPDNWKPGTMVGLEVEITLTSQPKGPDGFKRKKQTLMFALPKAPDGKPNELWLVLKPNGKFELVASNVEPSHMKWPGSIKGWPVASKAYRQKQIREELAESEGTLQLFQADQQKIKNDPYGFAKAQWAYEVGERQDMEITKAYTGPADQRYVRYLKDETDRVVDQTQKKITALKKELE